MANVFRKFDGRTDGRSSLCFGLRESLGAPVDTDASRQHDEPQRRRLFSVAPESVWVSREYSGTVLLRSCFKMRDVMTAYWGFFSGSVITASLH